MTSARPLTALVVIVFETQVAACAGSRTPAEPQAAAAEKAVSSIDSSRPKPVTSVVPGSLLPAERDSGSESARGKCPNGFTLVPGGTAQLGSNWLSIDQNSYNVKAFCFQTDEVSSEAFQRCTAEGHCHLDAVPRSFAVCCKNNPGCSARNAVPASCMTDDELARYCEVIGGRLPTTVEWEYGARGTDGREFPGGLIGLGNPREEWLARDVSPFGVRALAFGVREWTSEVSAADLAKPSIAAVNAHLGRIGTPRIWVRGGSTAELRVPGLTPISAGSPTLADERSDYIGGRCVVDP